MSKNFAEGINNFVAMLFIAGVGLGVMLAYQTKAKKAESGEP